MEKLFVGTPIKIENVVVPPPYSSLLLTLNEERKCGEKFSLASKRQRLIKNYNWKL